jgi:hypothetical protein
MTTTLTPTVTATATPTVTATPIPTPTVTATPTLSPTLVPAPTCHEMLVDGSFESQEAWRLGPADNPPAYSGEVSRTGDWSMRLSVQPGQPPATLRAWVQQPASLPAHLTGAVLTYWLLDAPEAPAPASLLILIRDEAGKWHAIEPEPEATQPVPAAAGGGLDSVPEWRAVEAWLDPFAGQTVLLRLALVATDGEAATLNLDDVTLEVCEP